MMIKNVIEYLQAAARRYPNKVAFVDQNNSYTFIEVDNWARKIAISIHEICGESFINSPIAVHIEKSSECLIAFLGILYSGNYYSPLDPKMPRIRLEKIADVLNPKLYLSMGIANRDFLKDKQWIDISNLKLMQMDTSKCDYYTNILDIDPIYALFTSGSTGVPKGVVISHRGVVDYVEWLTDTFEFDNHIVFGNQAPFYFDNSILDIYSTLKHGATLVIIPDHMFIATASLIDFLNEHCVNTIFWVPSALIAVADSGILGKRRLDYIEKILFCGEVMPNKQLNMWRKEYPELLYANLYGPTEITDVCSYYIVDREFNDDDPLPIGKACRNMEIIVLNENDEVVKGDEKGELCVRGIGLSLGYYDSHEKSSEVFVQNPLNLLYRDIIYRTGDIVHFNEYGEIMYDSRKDFQIKHQGHRIELGEIEAALGTIEEIKQGCAVYDKENRRIVLYCILENEASINEREIYSRLKLKLPRYMLPGLIIFIDNFPFNSNGKIDRIKLTESLYYDK